MHQEHLQGYTTGITYAVQVVPSLGSQLAENRRYQIGLPSLTKFFLGIDNIPFDTIQSLSTDLCSEK